MDDVIMYMSIQVMLEYQQECIQDEKLVIYTIQMIDGIENSTV
jgi:hypothetical protein